MEKRTLHLALLAGLLVVVSGAVFVLTRDAFLSLVVLALLAGYALLEGLLWFGAA